VGKEAERRVNDIKTGKVQTIPGEEVFREPDYWKKRTKKT
jgi:hypothetical protein